MKTLQRYRLVGFLAIVAVILGASLLLAAMIDENTKAEDLFDRNLYESYLSMRISTEADIVADYEWQQILFMPLLPPDPNQTLTQNGGILPVTDWSAFSKEFIAALVPVVRDGITYWPVRVMEDASANPRRRLILNAKDEIIAEAPVPEDYDPAWWVKEQYPELYEVATAVSKSAKVSKTDYRTWLESFFDGSRLVMEYDIIDDNNLVQLVSKQSVEVALRTEEEKGGGGVMKMDWAGGSVTNLQFVDIALTPETNGVMSMTLAYPDDFTNRIGIVICTNLSDPEWSLLIVTNPATTTNTITYEDTDATNFDIRFYHAYNADYDGDGDGVSDGEERYLDGTDPNNPDDPPNVKGTVSYESYSGGQTGPIYVIAVASSNSWSTNYAAVLAQPGDYIIPKLPPDSYWIKAWRDSDGDGVADTNTEAWSAYPTNLTVTGQVTNINLTLVDADTDADGLPDWWELLHFLVLTKIAAGDEEPDSLSNLSEYMAGTDPNVADTGYIPNDKYGQNWPTNIPVPPPDLGAPTQEREYKFSFSGITSVRPNDGVARALIERIDDVLVDLLADRSNWTVYAALDAFEPGGNVHNITNPAANAEFTREFSPETEGADSSWPTHTAFMDIYFDTTNNLNYTYDVSYRLRQRFDGTERWRTHMAGDTNVLSTRVEFMSKTYRMIDEEKPGFSEVTENRGLVIGLPPLPATNIQARIDRFQDGRWPADMQDFGGGPHSETNKVGNPAWSVRDYLVDVAPEVSEYDLLKFRPKLVEMSERRRQHLNMDGLLLGWTTNFHNVFIVSVDSAHVYEEAPLLAYMKGETNSMPPSLGSFVELEIEFERDTSDGLDDLIAAETNAVVLANLMLLRQAFLDDQQMVMEAIENEFNSKPDDLTAFYTIKTSLQDMSAHGQVNGSGVSRQDIDGIVGAGLEFNGNGYVTIVADTNRTPNTVYVDTNSPFILSEFQTRDNRDAIRDEDGNNPDWIEIQNVSSNAQSLNGWYLTDNGGNLTKWRFPAVTVNTGGCLVVFASGNNRTNPAAPLHANFSISGGGEYLALVRSNGTTIATEYDTPSIMNFDYDVSYGIVTSGAGYVEGYFNASPGEPNQDIYPPAPMELGNTNFTISLWLKTTAAGSAILSKSNTNGVFDAGEKQLYLDANGIVRYVAQGAGSVVGTTAVNDGQWHHIAVTFAVGSGVSALYIDGADDTASPATNFVATADTAGANVYLGYDTSTNATSNLIGILDEVSIWGRTLSSTEVSAIYNAALQGNALDTRSHLSSLLLYHGAMDVFLEPNADTKYRQAYDMTYGAP